MLYGLGLGASAFLTPGLFAEALMEPTPRQTEGPFYPDEMPLDTDNDLLVIGDSLTPAVGEVTHLTGVVKNIKGDLVRNALVEIWQVGAKGNPGRACKRRHIDDQLRFFTIGFGQSIT